MASKIYYQIILLFLIITGFTHNTHGQTLDFTVGMDSALAGSIIEIPVTVNNFNLIQGYQGTLRFDTAVVDFVSLTSPTPVINNIFGSPGMGLIPLDAATFTWVDFSGNGKTVANGSEVMKLTLQIKNGVAPGTYPVIMNSSVTLLGYSIGTGLITPGVTQGSFTVINCLPTANAGFTFPSSMCFNGTNPSATITGDPGGIFSVDQGANINPNTGELVLGSTVGGNTYTITYSVGASCPATSTQTIQVLGLDDASFLFADTVCINGFNPGAIITGLSGGSFSVDNGASINSLAGILDLSTTSAGNDYNITYQTQGSCPNSSTNSVHILAVDDASFTIIDTVCISDVNPTATITGLTGGIFLIDNGAVIDPFTGVLDLTTTVPDNTYNITYQTQGDCPEISSQSIFVSDSADASFLYPTTLCPGSPNPLAIVTGNLGGTFSVSPSATINSVTGELNLTTVTVGTSYTVTYSFNDVCQSSSQKQIVVEDFTAPDSATLSPIMGECSATVPTPITTDNCAGLIQGTTSDALSYSVQGTYFVNWTFDDGNGNQTIQTQTVIVQDITPPVIACMNLSIQLNANGMAMISPSQLDSGTTDACGMFTLSVSQDSFTVNELGVNQVYLIATDANGNIDSCLATVTVISYPAPVAMCQDMTVYLDSLGLAVIAPQDLDGGSTVNQGTPMLSISQDSFSCSDIGMNQVIFSVADSNGVMNSCMAMVTVIDSIAPEVNLQDITAYLDSTGNVHISATDLDMGSFDACGIDSMIVNIDSFSCEEVGPNPVIITVFDQSGNSSQGSATVTVVDSIAAEINLQDIIVHLDSAGFASIQVSDLDSGSFDACGIDSMIVDMDSFSCGEVGPNEVMVTVLDANGNSSQASAMVMVEDSIAPVVICQNISVMLDSTGFAIIDPSMIDGGSSDACGIMSMEVSQDTFSGHDIGVNTVMLTVTDNNGNINTCMAEVKVEYTTSIKDLNAPNLSLKAFPNPVDDVLQLRWDSPWYGEVSINIVNTTGQIVKSKTRSKNMSVLEGNMNLENLAEGIYIIQLSQNGYSQYQRVMKK